MCFEKVTHGGILTIMNGRAQFAHLFEEVLHRAGRLEEDHRTGRTIADLGKSMGYLAWREGAVAGFQMYQIVSHLDDELAGDHEEPFVLIIVHVYGGAAFLDAVGIVDTQLAAGVLARNLAIELAAHDQKLFVKAVFTVLYFKSFAGEGDAGLRVCG